MKSIFYSLLQTMIDLEIKNLFVIPLFESKFKVTSDFSTIILTSNMEFLAVIKNVLL